MNTPTAQPPGNDPVSPKTASGKSEAMPGQFVSRVKLVMILGCFLFPLLIATVWLHFVRASGGELGMSARGQLIKPATPLTAFSVTEADGNAFTEESLQGIWTMLYAPVGECGEVCAQNIYHMRQVRLSLGHRMDRVQRAVALESPSQLSAEIRSEHPGLRILEGDRSPLTVQVEAATAGMNALEDEIYLIDPFGNLMMRFPADLDPKSMLKDVKHLLKVSRIG